MKAGLVSIATCLLPLAIAQPHRPSPAHQSVLRLLTHPPADAHRHGRVHEHRQNGKRDIVTDIVYVTATMPDVIVYVDQYGKPFMTSTVMPSSSTTFMTMTASNATRTASSTASTSDPVVSAYAAASSADAPYVYSFTAAPAAASSAAPAPVAASSADAVSIIYTTVTYAPPSAYSAPAASSAAPVVVSSAAAPAYSAPAAAPSSAAAPASSSSSSSGGSANSLGIVYTPYTASGNCKSASEVARDIAALPAYSTIRIYGVDCNQVANVAAAAAAHNAKLFLGLYSLATIAPDVLSMAAQLGGDWSRVDTVSVGNELVNSAAAPAAAVVAAIAEARILLAAAGYSGHVVTVDTVQAHLNNPELAAASDYAAVNCHAFFDGGVVSSGAGAFVLEQAQRVQAASGKRVVITESGWPSQGGSNAKAVASQPDQTAAIASLRSSFASAGGLFLFSAYNDLWKVDNIWTFGMFFVSCIATPYIADPSLLSRLRKVLGHLRHLLVVISPSPRPSLLLRSYSSINFSPPPPKSPSPRPTILFPLSHLS